MVERLALIVSLTAFLAACIGIVLHLDRSLFVIRTQFSLRTLLVMLAVLPPILAAAWVAWPRVYYVLFVPQGIKGLAIDNEDGTRTLLTPQPDGTVLREIRQSRRRPTLNRP